MRSASAFVAQVALLGALIGLPACTVGGDSDPTKAADRASDSRWARPVDATGRMSVATIWAGRGAPLVTWAAASARNDWPLYVAEQEPGGAWSSSKVGDGDLPVAVRAASSTVVAVWTRRGRGPGMKVLASQTSGTGWERPTVLRTAPRGRLISRPQLTVGPDGMMLATWEEYVEAEDPPDRTWPIAVHGSLQSGWTAPRQLRRGTFQEPWTSGDTGGGNAFVVLCEGREVVLVRVGGRAWKREPVARARGCFRPEVHVLEGQDILVSWLDGAARGWVRRLEGGRWRDAEVWKPASPKGSVSLAADVDADEEGNVLLGYVDERAAVHVREWRAGGDLGSDVAVMGPPTRGMAGGDYIVDPFVVELGEKGAALAWFRANDTLRGVVRPAVDRGWEALPALPSTTDFIPDPVGPVAALADDGAVVALVSSRDAQRAQVMELLGVAR